jgi:hypothetical protein
MYWPQGPLALPGDRNRQWTWLDFLELSAPFLPAEINATVGGLEKRDWQTQTKNVILCQMTFLKAMRGLDMGNDSCNR